MKSKHLHPLIITPGEPAGIGPDIVLSLAKQQSAYPFVVLADKTLLANRAERLGLSIRILDYDPKHPVEIAANTLTVLHMRAPNPTVCGQPVVENATYILETLKLATEKCLQGEFAALVTGPVHKGIINEAGDKTRIKFSGHTEYLQMITKTKTVVMMLATSDLRVALATTHLPLRDVAAALTIEGLYQTLVILNHDLKTKFSIQSPRILVAGLNPHAGEGGHLGCEEITVITPAIKRAQVNGINAVGPLAADTLFTPKYLTNAHAVLAMYHDQGLPVVKFKGFGEVVNITLGLPIIRTSVDHGTAFDVAGTGSADASSLIAAFNCAIALSSKENCSKENA